jgi:hypothetical protein
MSRLASDAAPDWLIEANSLSQVLMGGGGLLLILALLAAFLF